MYSVVSKLVVLFLTRFLGTQKMNRKARDVDLQLEPVVSDFGLFFGSNKSTFAVLESENKFLLKYLIAFR